MCGIVDKSMYILCLKVKRRVLYPDDGLAAHGIYVLWVKFGFKGNFYVKGHIKIEDKSNRLL